ncbi:MAG: type 2 lantipeptide synthetase LanM [Lactobacillales bacterium]|jgi:type 2 lantibiotic biosynthesis protein LanM|nr:type 2 lantipeptide synthetase LanM [Lactobacillales bacterium]
MIESSSKNIIDLDISVNMKQTLDNIWRKALTIEEKSKYYNENISKIDKRKLNEWKSIKNLIDDKYFNEMLSHRNLTEKAFAFSVSDFKGKCPEDLPDWLLLIKDVLDEYKHKDVKVDDIAISVLPFIEYVKRKIQSLNLADSDIELDSKVQEVFLHNYVTVILQILSKVLVIELEIYKKNHPKAAENSDQYFKNFLMYTFANQESYFQFFSKYAVCTRQISTRTKFALDNYFQFINALKESQVELKELLSVSKLCIQEVHLSAGDSHEQGKSVSIIKISDKKVVYKPKNLEVTESFGKLVDWFNQHSSLLDLKVPKGIYCKQYSFCEFISYDSCQTEVEVANFYRRMGYLVAISYVFAMNDLHLENVIAHGEYPVIIDGETIFHNTKKVDFEDHAFAKVKVAQVKNTVMESGLLPKSLEISDDFGNQIDLSGISGGIHDAKVKSLQAVNVNKADFHFEEKEMIRSKGENIPKLKAHKVDYLEYRLEIIQGFKEAIHFLEQEKETLLDEKGPLACFKGNKVRILLKGTQRYASILGFSNHPNYTQEMFYLEKLFENIWAYPHSDKRVVMSEIQDLLVGDVPIFYSYVDSTNLEDSLGRVIENFYSNFGIERARKRIANLNEKEIERQLDFLLTTLDCFEDIALINRESSLPLLQKKQKLDFLAQAREIANDLMKKAVWNEAHDELSFATLDFLAKRDQLGIRPTSEGLYDGLSGIALFFLELFIQTKEEKYFDFYKGSLQSAINLSKLKTELVSAYHGKLAPFFPILVEVKKLGKSEFISYIDEVIQEISKEDFSQIDTNDWINGGASLLTLFVEVYKVTNLDKVKEVANWLGKAFVKKWQKKELIDCKVGFAHGLSGIVRGLASFYEL